MSRAKSASFTKLSNGKHETFDYFFKVIFLGAPSVGKTSIQEMFITDTYSSNYITTLGVDFHNITLETAKGKLVKLQLWDTGGQERFRSMTKAYYRDAHGIALVTDITNPNTTVMALDYYLEAQKELISEPSFVMVANKCDMSYNPENMHSVNSIAKTLNTVCIDTSAKNGKNINNIFDVLIDKMIKKLHANLEHGKKKAKEEEVVIKLDDPIKSVVKEKEKSKCCG